MFSVIREFLSASAEYERSLLCLYVVVDGFTPCLYGLDQNRFQRI